MRPGSGVRALHVKLALMLLLLFLAAGTACLALVLWSSSQYHEEVTQYHNRDLAMYIAQRAPLIRDGRVDEEAMAELAHQAMVINPIVEVYLLDVQGRILAHTLPAETVLRERVDLSPVQAFLGAGRHFPTRGDDPREVGGRSVFSAFPVHDGERLAGYVYVVLGARQYESLPESLEASYALRLSLGGVLAVLLFGFSCLFVVFRLLTRPLRKLAGEIDHFQRTELSPDADTPRSADEIAALRRAFEVMRERIREQITRLRETDRMRRELVSNVSHDLRTPLASMQGYLETLTVKKLPEEERQRYLQIVHRHCLHLSRLVAGLFELSKLDLGLVAPDPEPFSMADLAQDVLQKLQLDAERRGVVLKLDVSRGVCTVQADIALMERVLENLVDNALHHTPQNGEVALRVEGSEAGVRVSVSDSGAGIEASEIPYISERYYQARRPTTARGREGTGLGLAIVKRILELHEATLEVRSVLGEGSVFSFEMPVLVGTARARAAERPD